MIKAIHHVALKCRGRENFEETLKFYEDVIGLKIAFRFDGGAMLTVNGDVLEIFEDGCESDKTGSVNHFAFLTDDPDECIRKVRAAGYEITAEPYDLTLNMDEPAGVAYPLRVAFCTGPVGESIEFFCSRSSFGTVGPEELTDRMVYDTPIGPVCMSKTEHEMYLEELEARGEKK